MADEIISESEELLKTVDRIERFHSKYRGFPSEETTGVISRMNDVTRSIDVVTPPQTRDELIALN